MKGNKWQRRAICPPGILLRVDITLRDALQGIWFAGRIWTAYELGRSVFFGIDTLRSYLFLGTCHYLPVVGCGLDLAMEGYLLGRSSMTFMKQEIATRWYLLSSVSPL